MGEYEARAKVVNPQAAKPPRYRRKRRFSGVKPARLTGLTSALCGDSPFGARVRGFFSPALDLRPLEVFSTAFAVRATLSSCPGDGQPPSS